MSFNREGFNARRYSLFIFLFYLLYAGERVGGSIPVLS